MSNKSIKKLLAGILAATMVIGSSSAVFASDYQDASKSSETTGVSVIEDKVEENKVHITLPTASAKMYDYVADPNDYINKTNGLGFGANVDVKTSAGAKLYFLQSTGVYAPTSASLRVISKSSADVKVNVKVTLNGTKKDTDADLATSISDDTKPLYIGIAAKTGSAYATTATGSGIAVLGDAFNYTTGGTTNDITLKGVEDNYEWTAVQTNAAIDATRKYKWDKKTTLTAEDEAKWQYLDFALVGKVNSAKWTAGMTSPQLKVVWGYEAVGVAPANAAPSIATTSYNYDRTANLPITFSLGSGDKAATAITSVSYSNTESGSYTAFPTDGTKYSVAGTTLTFKSGTFSTAGVGNHRFLKVQFNDDEGTTVVLDLTITA
jgi:hypothetical protein